MDLFKIETGNFKLDGGAIFGVVPKILWNKVYPADKNNLCNFAMRCLLIREEERLILIDCGIGNKQSEKFFSYYYLNGDDSLERSLSQNNFALNDITDVILTHLHFDHCGGAVTKDNKGNLTPSFREARYWISGPQWKWAMEPNQREKASFLLENIEPIEASGNLHFVNNEMNLTNSISLRFFNGHTEGLMVPVIKYGKYILVYVSDLIPTAAHIPPSWVCGFDTRPLVSIKERNAFMTEVVEKEYILFFEHDIYHECCTLRKTEKGFASDKFFTFREFLEKDF